MKKIIVAFLVLFPLCITAPVAIAQFAESTDPCHGCSDADRAQLAKIRKQSLAAQPQAVGGPVGSPTFVMPPQKPSGGAIEIGQAFGDFLQPYIDAIVNALILAALGWAFKRFTDKTGIEIDQKHQDALRTFLQNQAGSLIADGMVKIEGKKISVDNGALAQHANEIFSRLPDAAKHFGITPDKVGDVVAARIIDTIPQIAAGAQMLAQHATAAADDKPKTPPLP